MAVDPKEGERTYYHKLGLGGREHAKGKPFSDPRCGFYLSDIGALLALLPGPPARILDLGCGTGWTSRLLARAGYAVVGVDIAVEAIELAREVARLEGISAVEFRVGDYESVPALGEFDFVLFYDALHHAEDERQALTVAWTVLRAGGAVVAFEPGSGHGQSDLSKKAVEHYGVHEKDMPGRHIRRLARGIGFRRCLTLPAPHDITRSLYRRDYMKEGGTSLWLERAWGYVRTLQRLFWLNRTAVTILRK